jgi:hypothetical protein
MNDYDGNASGLKIYSSFFENPATKSKSKIQSSNYIPSLSMKS